MSATGDLPGLPGSELDADNEAAFDELARRSGAALRRPAPADGVRAIAARQRRQQALKASAVGGIAVVTLIGALVVVAQRDDPDRLPAVESVPATITTPTAPTPTTTATVPIDSSPATIPATTAAVSSLSTVPTSLAALPSLWVDLDPGATAPLPPAPIPALSGSALVWTETELIVWGGVRDDSTDRYSQEGAAFDPAAGTWRQIAPPPGTVTVGNVLWTGTEMLVWSGGIPDAVSAAYDPANDTWRLIADLPDPSGVAFWIGDEAVFLGDPGSGYHNYAYDPATDEWRRLADGPGEPAASWTGTMIITVTDTSSDTGTKLAGYDPATDRWRTLKGLDAGERPAVIPGRRGAASTVAMLSSASGGPVALLDDRGNAIGELPGKPDGPAPSCARPPGNSSCLIDMTHAVSVGGELLFWHNELGWALDLETKTWRSFPLDGREPKWDGTEVVAAGDLLFAWGAGRDGLVYRADIPE